ncbi:hypothetical protein ABFA07_016006 [Porites harrisoni]
MPSPIVHPHSCGLGNTGLGTSACPQQETAGNESYCRSRGGLSANQKEEHFASNDNSRGRRVDGLKSTSPFVDSLVQNVSRDVEQQNEAVANCEVPNGAAVKAGSLCAGMASGSYGL